MDYKFCTMTHFFSNVSIYVLLCFLLSIPLSNALVQASRRFQCGVLTSPALSPSSTQLSWTRCGPVTPPLCCLKFFPDLLLRAVVSGVERWHPRPEQGHPLGRRGQSYDFHSFFFFLPWKSSTKIWNTVWPQWQQGLCQTVLWLWAWRRHLEQRAGFLPLRTSSSHTRSFFTSRVFQTILFCELNDLVYVERNSMDRI